MKIFYYKLSLCDGHYCRGTIDIEAENEDEAYEKVCEIVGKILYHAFPYLDIEYCCELESIEEI